MFPAVALDQIPLVDSETMRRADEIAVSRFGLSILQMMENAGRGLAELAMTLFPRGRATVLVGKGGNAGGGLAAARHLMNRGVETTVALAFPIEEMKKEAALQLTTVKMMGADVVEESKPTDLVIDALLGYGAAGSPSGRVATLIEWVRSTSAHVVSLDLPSGLNSSNPNPKQAVHADATLTLALPKVDLFGASAVAGDLYLADIGIPSRVFAGLGLAIPPGLFRHSQVLRLTY